MAPITEGTEKTMTAEDVRRIEVDHLGHCVIPNCSGCAEWRRVLATYAALVEKTAEVERWKGKLEIADTFADAQLTDIGRLRAQLAEAQADSARLKLLAKWAATPMELDRMGGLEGDAPVGPFFLTFRGDPDTQYAAPTLADVIDKIEAEFASRQPDPAPGGPK